MTLDSSVMNVSIATVAKDVDTTVTGIQTAITLYTLVMASLMITGGKIGAIIGRSRAFSIGCVIYARGLAHHRARAEPRGPHPRLVVPRGHRRGADHAGDRRAGRVELRDGRTPARVRPRRVGRRDRGRGRPAHRRPVHDVLLVALGVRRRGGHRRRHPVLDTPHRRRAAGDASRASTSSAPCCRRSGSGCSSSASCARVRGVACSPSPTRPSGSACRRRSGSCSRAGSCSGCSSRGRRHLVARGREPLIDPAMLDNPQLQGGLTCSSSSTCSRPGSSSSCRCSSRSRSGSRPSRPASGCCRCRSRC